MSFSDKIPHLSLDGHRHPHPNEMNQNFFMTGLLGNTTTYVKYKFIPNQNIQLYQILSQNVPIFKCQVRYLVKFVKYINGKEEVFSRWMKTKLMYNYENHDIRTL